MIDECDEATVVENPGPREEGQGDIQWEGIATCISEVDREQIGIENRPLSEVVAWRGHVVAHQHTAGNWGGAALRTELKLMQADGAREIQIMAILVLRQQPEQSEIGLLRSRRPVAVKLKLIYLPDAARAEYGSHLEQHVITQPGKIYETEVIEYVILNIDRRNDQ